MLTKKRLEDIAWRAFHTALATAAASFTAHQADIIDLPTLQQFVILPAGTAALTAVWVYIRQMLPNTGIDVPEDGDA